MQHTIARLLKSSSRAGAIAALVAAALVLSPSRASATVLICNDAGGCLTVSGSCEYWAVQPPYICFTLGPIAFRNPHLVRDANGGASFVNDGKTNAVMSDAAESALMKFVEGRNRERAGKETRGTDQRPFDTAFKTADRRVSDQRLQKIGRELQLSVEKAGDAKGSDQASKSAGGGGAGKVSVQDVSKKKDKDWDEGPGDVEKAWSWGMSPAHGPTQGGVRFTLTGSGFDGVRNVNWGEVVVPATVAPGGKELVVVAPEGEGTVRVLVNGVGGTGGGRYTFKPGTFTYDGPQLTGISPTSGPAAGGTLITITGANFGLKPTVKFGNQTAVIKERSHSRLVVVSPSTSGSSSEVAVEVGVAGERTPSKFPPGSPKFTYLRP